MEDIVKKKEGSPKRFVKCVCPNCRKNHKLFIYWVGSIPARKFCKKCGKIKDELGIAPITIIISGRDIDYHLSKKEKTDGN
jgi:Zn ribbon nucleic-acid-binding protein